MAENDTEETTMVLRTVYLPQELDSQLKRDAFNQGKSKNDIIREAVREHFARRNAPNGHNGVKADGTAKSNGNGAHGRKR